MNNNLLNQNFRDELLRIDVIPRKLNEISLKYKELLIEDFTNKVIETKEVSICQCGSHNFELLTNIDRFGLPFGSLLCQDCGLVLTNPIIKQKSLPYYYDKYYHPLNYGKETLENQSALFGIGQGKKIFNILESFLPKKDVINVLEIGAGTGNVLREFKIEAKEKNIDIEELGTEYSTDCINKCKNDGINVIEGDINTVVNLNKKFDVIILSHVFEHFIYLEEELKKLKKLMISDTLIYIEVPGILVNHKKSYYDYSFLGYLVHAHIYNFTLSSLANILKLNGFELIYGNEEVEVVCKISKDKEKTTINNDYNKILNYLDFLYQNNEYFLDKNNENNQNKILLTKKENMVFNRDQEISKLKEQLENRKKDIEKYIPMIEYRDQEISKLKEQLENIKKQKEIEIKKLLNDLDNNLKKFEFEINEKDLELLKYKNSIKTFSEANVIKKISLYDSSMENCLVSVIIPVYNVEEYLIECLKSVSNQTYKNIEIIAVNDGSKDNSLKILNDYKACEPRLKIIDQKNQGLSAARNSAIKVARGEYLIFLDSDDYIKKELVQEVFEKASKENADIVVYGYDKIYENKELIARPNFGENIYEHEISLKKILSLAISPMACNKMYKKDLFINNNIFYPLSKLHEDIGTTYKLFWNAKKVVTTSKSYYFWLVRDGSITSKTTYKHVNDIFDLFHEKRFFLEDLDIFERFRKEYEIGFIKMINLLFERLNSQDSCDISFTVLKYLTIRAKEEKKKFQFDENPHFEKLEKFLKSSESNNSNEVENLKEQLLKKNIELNKIYNSKEYLFLKKIYKLGNKILPVGSSRRELLKKILKKGK
jgi:glycosyltransferase involved in cell wall biosynthesis/SAM-dependent methyltransferase